MSVVKNALTTAGGGARCRPFRAETLIPQPLCIRRLSSGGGGGGGKGWRRRRRVVVETLRTSRGFYYPTPTLTYRGLSVRTRCVYT